MQNNSAGTIAGGSESSQGSTLAYMHAARRWMLWRADPDPKPDDPHHTRKVPYYVNGAKRGKTDCPEDWAQLASYQDALSVVGNFTGLAFALGPDELGGHWQGIDWDDLQRDHVEAWVTSVPGCYVEISPSGRGLHAIGYGQHFEPLGSNGSGLEAYAHGRYFTFTAHTLKDEPLSCLAQYVREHIAPRHQTHAQRGQAVNSAGSVYVDPKTVTELRSALMHLRADDRDLWVAVGQALKELGEIGRGLWIEWSRTSDKWKPEDAKKWDSFDGDRTGYKAVFKKAMDAGWVNPRSNSAQVGQTINIQLGGGKTEFRILTDKDLQTATPLRWLVKHVIPEEGFGTIFGDSGTYKSFVALDLLAAISRGAEQWFGHRIKPAPCVYVPFEGKGGVPRRVAAWRLSLTKRAYPDALVIAGPAEDVTTRMAFITDPMNLRNDADRTRLVETLRKNGWAGGVLCIDTLAQAGGGMDENSSEGMGTMIAIFQELQRRLGGVVLVIHHTGKDPTRGMRGWSGLRGALDFAIECQSDEKYQGRFLLDKVKDEEGGKQFLFTMQRVFLGYDEDGDEISSLVVVQPSHDLLPEMIAPPTEAQHDADDEAFIWEWVSREVDAGKYPSLNSLQGQLGEMKEQRPITQKRVRQAVHRLKALSALVTAPDKSPSGNAWLRAVQVMPK